MTQTQTTRRRSGKAVTKRAAEAGDDVVDGGQAGEDGGAGVIEPSRVIPPELKFSTRDRDADADDEGPRELPFEVDGETYTIIRPYKLDEVLAQLIEAGARRATTADVLYAGQRFLQRVIAPESLERLQRRLDDDGDPFRLEDLFDILERIANVLKDEQDRKSGNRGRGGRRR